MKTENIHNWNWRRYCVIARTHTHIYSVHTTNNILELCSHMFAKHCPEHSVKTEYV